METIGNIISTKDLSYMKDMFNWNFLASKKITHYLNMVMDEQVKEVLMNARDMHSSAAKTILSFMEGGSYEQ